MDKSKSFLKQFLTSIVFIAMFGFATTINVPADSSTIQAGINGASNGDTVLVAAGTYVENINFNGKNIAVIGEDRETTIIDGNQAGSVIVFESGEDTTAVLTRFTIQNGLASRGGGIKCNNNSSPKLTNIIITDNDASVNGGGMAVTNNSNPILMDIKIINNSADDGGGILLDSYCHPSITNVIISGNSATSGGGMGGGMYIDSYCNPSITNVIISGNSANSQGGGIIFTNRSNPNLENVTIIDNSSNYNGGGVFCRSYSNPTLKNVTISGNSSSYGSAVFCQQFSSPILVNTIVSDNIGGQAIYVESQNGSGNPSIAYSDFYNNQNGNFYNVDNWIGVNVTTNTNGDSCDIYYNIQLDPLFVDADNGDYNLQQGSSCIDAGDPTSPYDPDGSIADMGAFPSAYGTPVPIVINVPADYTTIQAALTAAGTNDTVLVQPGTYTENIIWPETNGIKLISAGDSSNTIIDGGGVSSVIYMNPQSATIDTTTLIQGFKITNGGGVDNGGGMLINQSDPKLEHLMVVNNVAGYKGGGLFLSISNAIIQTTNIFNNICNAHYTGGGGGGMYIGENSSPVVENSEINNNYANYNSSGGVGGGVAVRNSNPTFSNVLIRDNTAAAYGGGMYNDNSTSTLTGVEFYGNIAFQWGGGLFTSEGSNYDGVELTNVIVKNNQAGFYGGGMRLGDRSKLTNVVVVQNFAGEEGGGIDVRNEVTFTNVDICLNTSNLYGGGISILSSPSYSISGLNISNNSAPFGGGIFIQQSVVLSNMSISNNVGGGIFISSSYSSGNTTISNSNLVYNGNGLYNSGQIDYISATNNYWGDSSGPYHSSQNPNGQGDSVNTFVNVDPWLTTPNTDAPPIPAQNTTVTGTGNDFISLNWDASLIGDLAGYKLYYDSDFSGYPYANSIDIGTDTSYTLSSLTLGTTYYLAVTTYDTDGNESWYSNEVSGVTRVMQAQNLDIGGDEDLQHMISHTPSITFGYYDSMNETQTSYQVQVSTQSDYSSADMWDSGEVTSSDTSVTYAGTTLEDGATYYLRAKIGSGAFYSDWSTLTFRMNSTISMEDLGFDPDLGETSVYTEGFPTVSSSPTDSEGDSVFVNYMLSDNAGFSPLVDSALVYFDPSGADVSWQPTVDPLDNQQYWIKAKGYDGYEYGNESTTYSFMINSENDAPAAFTLTTPTDSSELTTLTPLLDWSVSLDPDPLDTVKYTLYLDTPDPGVTTIDVDTVTSYQVSTSLNDNTTYYWKVVANDLNGASTENTGGYHSFRINTENDLPGDFALLSPDSGSMVTDLTPTFHWEVPADADDRRNRSIVSYYVYLDTSLTGTVPDTVSTNSYTASTLLEDALYYWKVAAVDNDGGTTESSTWSFWTNNANSSPAAFTLLSPEDGEVLTIFNPSLIWSSTTDADLNDELSYSVELGTHIDSLSIVYTGSDTTFATSDLSENTTYYWQVTATDLSGATTENIGGYHSFRINTENDLPGNFALLSPDSGSMVTDLTPTFHWEVPADADDRRNRSIVSYYVYLDTSLTGTVPDTVSTNSYTASTLLEDALYYWKVAAVDNDGGTTESSIWSFWTNNANNSPAAFTLLTPTVNEETGLTPTFSWTASSDADLYDVIGYTLSYGSDPTSLTDVSTNSELTYTPETDLTDNTDYVWQVTAMDQSGATYTTELQSFMVNIANDNPDVFSLVSPDSGSVISDLPLLLVWTPTTDLDGDSVLFDIQLNGTSIGMTHHNYFFVDGLAEDMTYTWSVTATDNNGGSTQSGTWSFIVNTENVPPTPFALLSPEPETVLNTQVVFFEWETSTDSDPMDSVTYGLDVHTDTTHMHFEINTTSFTSEAFMDNRVYHWSVTAHDMNGGVTENIGGPRMFVINVENDPPTAPALVAPLNESIQTDLTPNFYWTPSIDPDPMDHVSYTMHWWPMGVLPVIYSANTDSNSFTPEENLTDNSQFGWMVTANDMHGAQSNSDSSYFYTDAFPEPPLNFATVTPENNAEGIATEVEFVWNQTYDPDPLDEVHYQLVYATDWEDSSIYVFSELIQDTSITLELEDNAQYYWMVIALDTDGFIVGSNENTPNTMVVGTLSIDGADIPEVFALHQNYPNPFNPTTQIKYDLPEDALVSITIYDIMGRSIKSLVNSQQTAGYRSIQWNATNNLGEPVSAGMYIYMIQAGEFRQVRKMVLLK